MNVTLSKALNKKKKDDKIPSATWPLINQIIYNVHILQDFIGFCVKN